MQLFRPKRQPELEVNFTLTFTSTRHSSNSRNNATQPAQDSTAREQLISLDATHSIGVSHAWHSPLPPSPSSGPGSGSESTYSICAKPLPFNAVRIVACCHTFHCYCLSACLEKSNACSNSGTELYEAEVRLVRQSLQMTVATCEHASTPRP